MMRWHKIRWGYFSALVCSLVMLSLWAVCPDAAGQSEGVVLRTGIGNPIDLETRVMRRALDELPAAAPIFPKDSVNLNLNERTAQGIRFFVGQKEARETIQFPRIVANYAYTRTQPPQLYLVNEQQQGMADFHIFANEVEVLIDAKPTFPRWKSTASELADAYNQEQEENRRQEAARPSGTSSTFRTKRSLPGQASEEYMTKREAHMYAVAEDRDYHGLPGELVAFRNRCVEPGYPLECYGELIFRVFKGDVGTQIEARARLVRGADEVLLQIKYHGLRNSGLPDRILHTEHVDAMMKTLAKILLEELGEQVVSDTPPQLDSSPTSVPPRPPVVAEPEPVRPPADTPHPLGPTIADRIQQMDAMFEGAEDMLQGTLFLVGVVTQTIQQQQEQSRSLVRALDSIDLGEEEKAPIRAKLRELAESIRALTGEREQLEREAREVMRQLVEGAREKYREGDWGNSDFNAFTRLLAAEERSELFEGQLMLVGNHIDRLMAYASKMQEAEPGSATRKNGLYLEGLAYLRHGRLIDALELFRTVRRAGYVTKGTKYEEMETVAEVEILRAMQEQTVATRVGFHQEFGEWLGQHVDIGERDSNATWTDLAYWQDRMDWWVDGSTWMSWYRTVQGAMGALPEALVGETEAAARAREVGEVHDSMALKHVGLGMIIGLRKKGYSLDLIQRMDTEGFREACQKAWERELPTEEARQKLQAIRAAFELEDLQRLATDEVLVEGDLRLSEDLVKQIELDDDFRTADWAGWFGDTMVTPGNVVMMFAPMAKFSTTAGYSGRFTTSGLQLEKQLQGVHTLAEVFQSSRPYTWAVQKLAQTSMGSSLLEGAATAHQFAGQGRLQAFSVFLTEAAMQMGASFTVGQTLGPETQFLFDMFVSLGGADVRTLGNTVEKLGMRRGHFQHFATRTQNAASRALREVDEAGRLSQAIRKAVEEGAPAEKLSALRRELAALPELSPELGTKLQGAMRQIEAGAGLDAVRQTLDDLDNLRTVRGDQARNARHLAREFDDLATRLPEGLAAPASGQQTLVPTADPNAPTTPALRQRPPSPDARYDPNELNPLARRGDRRMMQGRFAEAADAYEALLVQGRMGQTTEDVIRAKRDIARRSARLQARMDTPADEFVQEFTDALERQVREAIEAGRYERAGVRKTASSPRAVFDQQGRPIAYFKEAELRFDDGVSPANRVIRQGEAEVLASNLHRVGGRPGPAARLIDGLEIDGATRNIVAIRTFPEGRELADSLSRLANHPRIGGADWIVPTVLVHKREIADDIVMAMVLGDGDRHFGNLWSSRGRRATGFDYGLADFLPEHAWYRNNSYRDSLLRNARNNFDDVVRVAQQRTGMSEEALMAVANPGDDLRRWQESVQRAREVFAEKVKAVDASAASLYRVPDQPLPPDFRTDPEGFKAYAQKLMDRHWTWGTRNWSSATGDYLHSVIRFEDVAPQIQSLRRLKDSGGMEEIVRRSLKHAAEDQVQFATRMLEVRIEILEEFFRNKFRSLPDGASILRRPRLGGPEHVPVHFTGALWRLAA